MNQDINYWIARCASLEQDIDIMKEQSTIKWQTGEPNEAAYCLVTMNTGDVKILTWLPSLDCWVSRGLEKFYNVTAWCKLSDIKPYEEVKK